ncbi:MAG: hydroxyacid dehydrogenase [Silicimonas sp.]
MTHVLVVGSIHPDAVAMLEAADGVTYELTDGATEDCYAHRIADADVLLIRTQPMTEATISNAKRLRLVSRHGVGYDAVDTNALTKRGIPLCIVGDVNSGGVAEHAIMMILASVKLAVRSDAAVRNGDWSWRNTLEAGEIGGKNLLILGYGRIGGKLARLAKGFDMTVKAFDPFLAANGWPEGDVQPVDTLEEALAWADVISIHAPKPDKPLIGERELAAMKATAVIVNTSRGGIIDEKALADALRSRKIRAAGIDVFDIEPPLPDNPLFGLDNVLLSPHIAGLTQEGSERLGVHSVRNILDFLSGRLDPSLVVNGVSLDG